MVKNNRTAKTGTFANQFRGPKKNESTLDWDAVMRGHRPPEEAGPKLPASLQLTLAELDRANRGVQNHYDGMDGDREARVKGGKKGRAAPFDVDQVVRMYVEEKMPISKIALQVGSAPITVLRYLKKADVYTSGRDKGKNLKGAIRPKDTYVRKERCSRDHDLTAEGATYEVWKTRKGKRIRNGRACVECKKVRDRQAKKRAEG